MTLPPPPRPTGKAVGRRSLALRGSLWTLIGYGGSQLLRLGSNLVLARLLFPEAFGLMALVNVFIQGLQMFSDIGLGPAIIQSRRGEEPAFCRTAWTMQIIRGTILWLMSCALALPIASFFAANDPQAAELAVLLPVAGLTALLGGFTSTGIFLLNRQMRIGRLTALELIPQGCSILLMIGWARLSPGVWALVAGGLAYSVVRLALSHRWNPGQADRLAWDQSAAVELFRFGKWVFFSTLVTFLASHLDRLLLGRLLSMTELGLYSIAMTFARVAIHTSSRLSSLVIFPLLATLRDEPRRLVEACLRARSPVLWLSAAVCAAFALVAPLFFTTLYDQRYADAGTIARWLALYTWSHVLVSSMDRIPLALGAPRVLFVANLLTAIGMAMALFGYHAAALPGFIVGMSLANLVAHLYLLAVLGHCRRAMTRQSLVFSLGLFAYTLPMIFLLTRLQESLASSAWLAATALAAGLPLLLGAWRVHRAVRPRREVGG